MRYFSNRQTGAPSQRILLSRPLIVHDDTKNGRVHSISLPPCTCGPEQRGPKGGVCRCGNAIPTRRRPKKPRMKKLYKKP
jgi:hypothetical protein